MKKAYWILLALSVVEIVIAFAFFPEDINQLDGPSYICAAENLSVGQVDLIRPPLYPALIEFCRILFGSGWIVAVIVLQYVAFYASAWVLRKISVKYIGDNAVTFCIVALFMLWPALPAYFCRILMTETFATALLVFFTWSLVRPLPGVPRFSDICLSLLLMLLMVSLKPVFIYLLPVAALFYLLVLIGSHGAFGWKKSASAFAGIAAIIAIVFMYKSAVTDTYGIKSISYVTSLNQYCTFRQKSILSPELCSDPELRSVLQQFPDSTKDYDWRDYAHELIALNAVEHYPEFEEYVGKVTAANRFRITKHIVSRTVNVAGPRPILYNFFPFHHFVPSFFFYLMSGVVFMIWILYDWRKTHKIPLLSYVLMAVTYGLAICSLVGAQGEWARLSLPGIFAYFILLGKFLTLWGRKKSITAT